MRRFGVILVGFVVIGLAASSVLAQPFYVRGEMNGWGTSDVMTDQGGGHYTASLTGFTPGTMYEYKVAEEDWDPNWPGSNGRIMVDGSGEMNFHLWLNPPADGWSPTWTRVGYEDPGHGWDIMGSFNGWSDPVVVLAPQGGGLYTGSYLVPTAGSYEFKFRKAGDWGISIGDDFGNSAGNAWYTTTTDNELAIFELDLPGGRWRVVPEPATLGLLLIGGIGLLCRRRA